LEETHLIPLPEVWTLWWGIGADGLAMFSTPATRSVSMQGFEQFLAC
jgi:hypothetical protein